MVMRMRGRVSCQRQRARALLSAAPYAPIQSAKLTLLARGFAAAGQGPSVNGGAPGEVVAAYRSGYIGQMSGKRELIDTGTDKRYVRRDEKGQFRESDDVGRSLSYDVKRHGKTESKSGQGDKGDTKRSVRGTYSLPNGDQIVTIRRDVVDRALGRADRKR